MAKVDSLDISYNKLNKLDSITNWLLVLSVVIAILNFWFSECCIMVVLTILITISYLSFSVYTQIYANLIGDKRITNAIEDGFGKDINTDVNTCGYYNNELPQGINKFNLNIFESVYFTKHVFEASVFKTYALYISMLSMMIIVLMFSNPQLGVVIFEAILGGDILLNLIQTIFFQIKISQLYLQYDNIYTAGDYNKKKHSLLALAIKYERTKAFYSLKLDSKTFQKMNEKLTVKWKDYCIKNRLYTNKQND